MNAPLLPGRIEHWPLARLRPYARNAKTHDADQMAKIAASMVEFGWTVPCLVAADGELIAGHGRVLAAAQLGLAEAPVIVLDHLTEAQRRAYRISGLVLCFDITSLAHCDAVGGARHPPHLLGISDDDLDALLRDAEAICEAAMRPTMRFVPVKSEEAQGSAMVFRIRALLIRQRTQAINALRGHLGARAE